VGAPLGELLSGDSEGYGWRAQGTDITPWGLIYQTGYFEIWVKGALEVWCLSLWELCEGNLEAGLPCWGP